MKGVADGRPGQRLEQRGRRTHRQEIRGSITLKPTAAFARRELCRRPEQAGNNKNWRHLSDTVISYAASPMVSLLGTMITRGSRSAARACTGSGRRSAMGKFQANKWVAVSSFAGTSRRSGPSAVFGHGIFTLGRMCSTLADTPVAHRISRRLPDVGVRVAVAKDQEFGIRGCLCLTAAYRWRAGPEPV